MIRPANVPLFVLLAMGAWLFVVTESPAQWSAPIRQVMPDGVTVLEWSWHASTGSVKVGPPANPTPITEPPGLPAALPAKQANYWDATRGDFVIKSGLDLLVADAEYFYLFPFDTHTGKAWFIDAYKPAPITWKFIGGSPVAGGGRNAYAFTVVKASKLELVVTRRDAQNHSWTSTNGGPWTPSQGIVAKVWTGKFRFFQGGRLVIGVGKDQDPAAFQVADNLKVTIVTKNHKKELAAKDAFQGLKQGAEVTITLNASTVVSITVLEPNQGGFLNIDIEIQPNGGALVTAVRAGPAMQLELANQRTTKARMVPGDIILRVGGKAIRTADDLRNGLTPGVEITITVRDFFTGRVDDWIVRPTAPR